jgi:hypothetical protein
MTPAVRYANSDLCHLAEVSAPTLKNLVRGKVIRKQAKGSGFHHVFTLNDVVKVAVSKALLVVGVDVENLREMFRAIDKSPAVLPDARPWAWLQTPDRHTDGAYVCIVYDHPLVPAGHGAICLTTRSGAERFTKAKVKSIVIDIHSLITQIEARAGVPYGARVS